MKSLKMFKNKFQITSIYFVFILFLPILSYGQPVCEDSFLKRIRGLVKQEKQVEELRPVSTLDPHEHVRRSVWKINIGIYSGTGFFISPNRFVTNFHVMRHFRNLSDIYLSQEDSSRILKVKRIIGLSALHDLALLETDQLVDFHLQIREESLQEGALFITGYPNGKLEEMRNTDTYIRHSDDEYSFYTDYDGALFGMSGSPVVDEKGQVTGVVFASAEDKEVWHNVNSVKLNHLKDFIREDAVLNCRNYSCVRAEIETLKSYAEEGSAQAQFVLALMYINALLIDQSFEQAFYWTQQSANQGYVRAQGLLGKMYIDGQGVEANLQKGLYWFQQAANQGSVDAQIVLATTYLEGTLVSQNFEQTFFWFKQAAEQGLPLAQYNLALMYDRGDGVEQNQELSFYWFQKSAQQGYVEAQLNAAAMYYHGEGVEQNFERAFYWFKQAAERGRIEAQFYLSVMYYDGTGVKQNLEKAFFWSEQAALQGYIRAQFNLGVMYDKGEGVRQDFKQAVYWYQKAAEQGFAEAQFNLGSMYAREIKEQDFKKAFYWFHQSALQGIDQAQYNLAAFYEMGKGVEQNLEQAIYWYRQSAEQGYADAQSALDRLSKQ